MVEEGQADGEMLKGTLDMMILRTLVAGDAHGHTIAKVIERTSEDVLEVEQGSLYPALHRLEDRGWVSSYWGASENNRKAKFYRLTAAGKKQLVPRNESLAADDAGHRAGDGRRDAGLREDGMSWLRFFRRRRQRTPNCSRKSIAIWQKKIAENTARGMSPDEARRQARIKLGIRNGCGRRCGSRTALRRWRMPGGICAMPSTPQTVAGIHRDGDSGDCAGNRGEYRRCSQWCILY